MTTSTTQIPSRGGFPSFFLARVFGANTPCEVKTTADLKLSNLGYDYYLNQKRLLNKNLTSEEAADIKNSINSLKKRLTIINEERNIYLSKIRDNSSEILSPSNPFQKQIEVPSSCFLFHQQIVDFLNQLDSQKT